MRYADKQKEAMRHKLFIIGEILVREDKMEMSAEQAVERIREIMKDYNVLYS